MMKTMDAGSASALATAEQLGVTIQKQPGATTRAQSRALRAADVPVASPVPLLTGFNHDEYGLFGAPSNQAAFAQMVHERGAEFAARFKAFSNFFPPQAVSCHCFDSVLLPYQSAPATGQNGRRRNCMRSR